MSYVAIVIGAVLLGAIAVAFVEIAVTARRPKCPVCHNPYPEKTPGGYYCRYCGKIFYA